MYRVRIWIEENNERPRFLYTTSTTIILINFSKFVKSNITRIEIQQLIGVIFLCVLFKGIDELL